jgi:hypothetical protein
MKDILHDVIYSYFDDSKDEKTGKFVACGGVLGEEFPMTVVENLWAKSQSTLENHSMRPIVSVNGDTLRIGVKRIAPRL